MQVSLSEKILSHLAGSNSVNPVIESELLRLGRKIDVIQELNNLDSARRIIRCKVTKGSVSNEFIYLSGQIVRPGELRLHNLFGGKKEIKERLRYCKGCDQYLPKNSFASLARKCIDCNAIKQKQAVFKKKEKEIIFRHCFICNVKHPQSAFEGVSRRCIATKDRHARHIADGRTARQRKYSAKVRTSAASGADTTKRASNRKGITLSVEIRAKMAAGQKARYERAQRT